MVNSMQTTLMDWVERLMPAKSGAELVRVCVRNVTRHYTVADRVEVADRGARRRKGLLGRDGLALGEGLWIVPCEAVHTFGMRFGLDLIFLDRRRRIVKIRRNVQAGRIAVCLRAHSTLELPAGSVPDSVRPGDQLSLDSILPV